jgi:predicted cupin superfamily sugar epimerase
MPLTADAIIKLLDLRPPTTCGYVSEPYRSPLEIPQSALPAGFVGSRSLGNVLYFLVTPEARVRLHRIRSDQMYHHYLGAPLEVLLLYADGRSEMKTVGSDLAAGERPQLFIPGGTFHTARVKAGGD